jgi:hypothetical protein
VTAPALLRVICLVVAASLAPAAAPAQTAAPSAVPSAVSSAIPRVRCAPTIDQFLQRNKIKPDIGERTFEGYGLAIFSLKTDPVSSTAWFRRQDELWCLVGYGTDVVDPKRGIELGVPEPIASKLVALISERDSKRQ